MSKLDIHSVSLKVRDIQVWQPSMALALVEWYLSVSDNFRKSIMICQIIVWTITLVNIFDISYLFVCILGIITKSLLTVS